MKAKMPKQLLIYTYLFSLCIFAIGCQKKNKEVFEKFYSSKINLSLNQMQFVGKDSLWYNDSDFKQIVYVDSIKCNACMLNKVGYWLAFYKEAHKANSNFRLCFIFQENNHSKKMIDKIKYYYEFSPIFYIDSVGVFIKNNPIIIENTLFHSFLIKNGRIQLFGDPTVNNKIADLTLKLISDKKENDEQK